MRLPTFLNWALLGANVILCLFLLVRLHAPSGSSPLTPTGHRVLADGPILGMAAQDQIGPFVLLTGKDFPRDKSFQLTEQYPPLNPGLSVLDGMYFGATDEGVKHIGMNVGPDFSISCMCTPAKAAVDIRDLTVTRTKDGQGETFTDINVDGICDVRQTRDEKARRSRLDVLYRGEWRETLGGDKDPTQDRWHKQLLDGTRVYFDRQSGRWTSATDKPAAKREDATRPPMSPPSTASAPKK